MKLRNSQKSIKNPIATPIVLRLTEIVARAKLSKQKREQYYVKAIN